MTTYYKGKIGKQDIDFGTGTFVRRNKDLGYGQLDQVNDSAIPLLSDSEKLISDLFDGGYDVDIYPRKMIAKSSADTTMTTHETFVSTDGHSFWRDPGGAERNFNPSGTFVRNHQITIVNTADADEDITFDSTVLAQTVGQNQTGTFIYNGSTWNLQNITSNTVLQDADGDTKIQVEESSDEDIIRMDIAGTEKVVLDATGVIIGTPAGATADGTVHAFTATAGAVTASTSADEGVFENSADGGISILTPDANTGYLMFGDASDNDVGSIAYDHGTGMIVTVEATEAMRIDSSQRLIIGDTTTRTIGGLDSGLQLNNSSGQLASMALTRWANNAGGSTFSFGKSRSGTVGTHTVVQDNDLLGTTVYAGADGTDLESIGASIFARIDGTPGANYIPTELVFSVNSGAATPTERVIISPSGAVQIGVTNQITATSLAAVSNVATDYTAIFQNDGNNANRYGVKIQAGADTPADGTRYITFADGDGGERGEIEETGGALAYTIGSDKRLKTNIKDSKINATEIVRNTIVNSFDWIASGSHVEADFIAQELTKLVPSAVAGKIGETVKYEAERKRGNIIKEVTEEISRKDAIEEIEIDELIIEKKEVYNHEKKKNEIIKSYVIDRMETVKELDENTGEIINIEKTIYKTKPTKKKVLKNDCKLDQKTGIIYRIYNKIIEEDVDIRDYNRNKKELGQFIKTKEAVIGTREKMLRIAKDRLIPILWKMNQELLVRLETLEKK